MFLMFGGPYFLMHWVISLYTHILSVIKCESLYSFFFSLYYWWQIYICHCLLASHWKILLIVVMPYVSFSSKCAMILYHQWDLFHLFLLSWYSLTRCQGHSKYGRSLFNSFFYKMKAVINFLRWAGLSSPVPLCLGLRPRPCVSTVASSAE